MTTRVYQENIGKPTKSLSEQVLKDLTEHPVNNALIDNYRDAKRQMAEAEAQQSVKKLVKKYVTLEKYQKWLAKELKKDEKRKKKLVPNDDLGRVKLYIAQLKSSLPAVIPTVTHFAEHKDKYGRIGLWREQKYGYLSGLAVLDADHVDNPEELIAAWMQREDFKELGIVWIFITPSGKGIKVVFKAREEWGNLQDNAYQMAEILGVLDFADGQTKNSDHSHFIPKACDVKFIDWKELFTYENLEYEARFGEAYRKGESAPTNPKWQELERKRSEQRKGKAAAATMQGGTSTATISTQPIVLSERELTIVKALNEHYGETIAEGHRHETWLGETAPWLLLLTDNNADKALAMGRQLDYVKNWTDQTAGELENCISTVQKKPLLRRRPKVLAELLVKAGIDREVPSAVNHNNDPIAELPFDKWCDIIEASFPEYPCLREVCGTHPRSLWPFLFFAASALFGTLMTLTYWFFYDRPEKRRRLNYNILGVGDPASGKGALEGLAAMLTEPIEVADQMANDAMNAWKEEQRSKSQNKDKSAKPKGIVRLHGARTSNNVFINDMMNAFVEMNGTRMQMHMLTIDTEALNSIKMQSGGSWIDKQVMEIKAWSNERDSQQYGNIDSVTGFFHVYWNLIRTCTPPALKVLCSEKNFGTGYPTRLSVIPVLGTGFKMIELRKKCQQVLDSEETLKTWAYRMDKRQGELPIWPLVERAWHWTYDHMEMAAFNQDKAEELLLKRISQTSLCIAAPWVDMRHYEEREKTGTYTPDEQDMALLDLVMDIQYQTQQFYFYELARNYFDNQMKDPTTYRRRTNKFVECFRQLPDEFSTEQFSQIFGYANNRAGQKTLQRLEEDKAIKRTKRGFYKKLSSEL